MVESNKQDKIVSKREFEILKLLIRGNTTKEIAVILNVNPETVITHRKNLLKKFRVRNCAELIYVVTRLDLI